MKFEVLTSNRIPAVSNQIAHVHSLAYSSDHFTSGFNLKKLAEYNQMLVSASDLSVVAIEDHKIVGFIIAGCEVSAGVQEFINRNRFWVLLQLFQSPTILFNKIYTKIVGKLIPSPPSGAKLRLLSIAISPFAQGQGIGSSMLAFFESELRKRKVNLYGLSVKSKNQGAIRFYERHGFRKEKEVFNSIYFIKAL